MKSHIETDMVTREMERTRDPAGAGKGDAGIQRRAEMGRDRREERNIERSTQMRREL